MPAVRMNRSDTTELWRRYRETHDPVLRNRLMEIYIPLVKYNAERIAAKLPDEVDVNDLVSAGIFGLVNAIEAFDLGRGVKFETYCAPRVRGARRVWRRRLRRSPCQAAPGSRHDLGREPGQPHLDLALLPRRPHVADRRHIVLLQRPRWGSRHGWTW